MSGTSRALRSIDLNSSTPHRPDAERNSGEPLSDMKAMNMSINSIDMSHDHGDSKITPKKRRIEAEKENVGTPGRAFPIHNRGGLGGVTTPIRSPLRSSGGLGGDDEGDDSMMSLTGRMNVDRGRGTTPPRSASRVGTLNASSISTPGSTNKRKAGEAAAAAAEAAAAATSSSWDHDPYHSQSSPKDMYPPAGEKPAPQEDPTTRLPSSSTDLRSSLVDRLRSIEENLTSLNKANVVQEPPSPFVPAPALKSLSSASASKSSSYISSSGSKGKTASFMEPSPTNPRQPGESAKAAAGAHKSLRQSMAAAKASIESNRIKSELADASTADSDADLEEEIEETVPPVAMPPVMLARGKEELNDDKEDPPIAASSSSNNHKKDTGAHPSSSSASSSSFGEEKDAKSKPVHLLSHVEFRNHMLAARVGAASTLLRSKDKLRANASFITEQLDHYRALSKGEAEHNHGQMPLRGTGNSKVAVDMYSMALVSCVDSEPLAPLGDQSAHRPLVRGAAPTVPLTEMSLLQEKLSSWKTKYCPGEEDSGHEEEGKKGEEEEGQGEEGNDDDIRKGSESKEISSSGGGGLEMLLMSAEKSPKAAHMPTDEDDISI